MSLTGRGVVLTGASEGLGREMATHFVREGAHVLLVARRQAPLLAVREEVARAARPSQVVLAVAGDVSSPDDVARIADRAHAALPGVCVLVNNAGIYGPMGPIETAAWDDWEYAIRVNLFGTALMCRAFIPALRARGYGKIINVSGGGATAPLPGISAYAAAKAAVVRLTETLAQELAPAGVDVNAFAPGALNTRLLDEVLAAGPERVGEAFYARSLKQRDEGGAPLARGAELAVFLASAASDGITGRLLSALWDDWANLPSRWPDLAPTDVYTLRRIVPADREPRR